MVNRHLLQKWPDQGLKESNSTTISSWDSRAIHSLALADHLGSEFVLFEFEVGRNVVVQT